MNLKFTSPLEQKPGIIAELLMRSYAELVSSDPKHWSAEEEEWRRYDREVFQLPHTIGECVFLSWFDHQLCGFGSYDSRQRPEFGIIGHNCILPKFRRRGFGKQQIFEIFQRFRPMDVKTARVSTCTHPFFAPAHRMYVACGFIETGRHSLDLHPSLEAIEYEKRIG